MAIRLSDIPDAPTRGIRLSDISMFPSGADPDKPLGFVRDFIPPAPTADRVDPKDVGLLPKPLMPMKPLKEVLIHGHKGAGNLMIDWLSNIAEQESEVGGKVRTWFWNKLGRDKPGYLEKMDETLGRWGKEMQTALQVYIKEHPEEQKRIPENADFWTTLGTYTTRPDVLAQALIENSPLMLIGGAGHAIAGAPASISLMGIPLSADIYSDARKEGTAVLPAFMQSALGGYGEAAIEEWTLGRKIGLAKSIGKIKGVPRMLWEGTKLFFRGMAEEGSQRFNRNLWNWVFTDRSQKLFQDVMVEAAAGGPLELAAGGIFAAGGRGIQMVSSKEKVARVEIFQEAIERSDLSVQEKQEIQEELNKAKQYAVTGEYPEAEVTRLENVPMFRAEAKEVVVFDAEQIKAQKRLDFLEKTGIVEADVTEKEQRGLEPSKDKVVVTKLVTEAEPVQPEIISPKLYIGNVTKRMKKVFGEIFGVAPEQVRGFTEKGFPTKRTGIEVTRRQAQEALDILTEDLNQQFRENKIRTENQLALANAHWGDVVQLREVLGLPAIPRPWKVIRAAKHIILEFENLKTRIQMAVQPSKMFQAGFTVQQVLVATMKKAEVASAKAWLESARSIVKSHKDLARYAAEKLKGLDITQAERDRLLSFVARGRTDLQKTMAVAGVEMLAEKADKRTAFIELREEVSKIKTRIGKTMQEKGIRPEYARKLNTLIDSFRTKKLSLWRLSDIGSLKNYLSNLKEGISNDPTIDETYAAKLAELLVPVARLRQLEQLSKSAINLLTAADVRTITTELQRLVGLNDLKNKIYLGKTARHAAEYLNRAVTEQEKVKDNSKIVKQQTAWTTAQKGGALREVWRYTAGIHNQDVKTLVWNIEGAKQGALYDVLVEGMREGRRIESEHEKKVTKYITDFLDQHKISPTDLAKLSSTFQQVFRDPQQKARKLFGAAVPTYKIGDTNWVMAELMSMYLHTKNDFSLRAMVSEGIASILEEKGTLSADDLVQVTTLVEKNRVAKLLTEMYEHIAENINKPAINAVSLVLKGIEIADINNYFTVERRSPGKIAGNQEFRISLLESQGFLQERTGSKNPVIIRDFFAVLNANIKGVAEYVGMAQPFRAAHTILSYKPLLKSIDSKGREVHRRHVNTLIERAESKIRPRGKVEAIFAKVLRAVPRAVLASPGIMGGQIMSEISYAATDIPTKYLIRMPVPSEKQVERVGERWAWAWARKHLGATSIETRNIASTDALLRMFTGKKAIINLPTQGINYVDMKAITFGWLAVERWVRDTTDLSGDALYTEINKRAHKAISESQPMFETENRSILTSSENVIARSFVMFRSYVDQTLRIFARAQQGRLNKTISRSKYLEMTGAVLAGFVAWKTMRLLIDALLFGKKKDPYEVAKDVALSPLRALNLVGYQVERQVSRMLDIWVGRKPQSRYWDTEFENLVLSTINEVWKATKDFSDAMAFYGTDEVYKSGVNKGKLKSDVLMEKAVTNLVLSIGKVYGLPTPVVRKALFSLKKKEKKSIFKTRKSIFKKRVR